MRPDVECSTADSSEGVSEPPYGWAVPSPRSTLGVDGSASELPDRSVSTATAVAVSVTAGLLAAVLSVPGAVALWVGISVAVGRGDPTWNDGEEVWATVVGLLLTGFVSFAIYSGVRALRVRVRAGVRKMVAFFWIVPIVAIHVLFAANFLS